MEEKTILDLNMDEAKANLTYVMAMCEVATAEVAAVEAEQKVAAMHAVRDRAYKAKLAASDAITAYYRRESEARAAAAKVTS